MDKKDKMILEYLQEDSRITLRELGKKINLSIDATKNRIDKLKKAEIIHLGAFINPTALGYEYVVDNKIKVSNITQEERRKFIAYLSELDACTTVIASSGEYDFTCVLIAKTGRELNDLIYSIREKFKHIISDWKTSFNLEVYKFEKYSF